MVNDEVVAGSELGYPQRETVALLAKAQSVTRRGSDRRAARSGDQYPSSRTVLMARETAVAEAVAVLPEGAAANPARPRDAALAIGYVDARIAALGSPRQRTEQQEYARVRIGSTALSAQSNPNN